ncbi:PDZ domain (Also known as DHR or GLGF) [Nesidiocoris tenuis]|uniref:PDZ domain (Also known as DHR or GLGF) n=1 Tax=Nesidiocoris tenuis TaxID=355587 RepID=A0ABN7AF29_9HEMI|nr:PDZ domain (Also known as DHR or GLGF) [Nesidiocoris tenuis]
MKYTLDQYAHGPDVGPKKSTDSSVMPCGVHHSYAGKMSSPGVTEPYPPLPTYSRLPPDGHEFPIHYDESNIENKNSYKSLPVPTTKPMFRQNMEITRKTSLPCTDPYKHALWRNDEKSEKSVRDKIAMFSNQSSLHPNSNIVAQPQLKKLNKFKSSDDVSLSQPFPSPPSPPKPLPTKSSAIEPSTAIKKGSFPYHSMMDVTSDFDAQLSKKDSSRTQSTTDLSDIGHFNVNPSKIECSTLPRKHEQKVGEKAKASNNAPTLTRAVSFSGTTKLHSRSQSLNDVGTRAQILNCRSMDEARRTSLNQLIEQRKKSMSKLRGLVIPEKVLEVPAPKLIADLPEIQSKDCPLPVVPENERKSISSQPPPQKIHEEIITSEKHASLHSQKPVMPVPPWKADASIYDLPKYSPAFKRKSLALYYGAPSSVSSVSSSLSSSREELRSCFNDVTKLQNCSVAHSSRNFPTPKNFASSPLSHSEPKSLESVTSPSISDMSFEYSSNSSSPSSRNHNFDNVHKSSKAESAVTAKSSCEVRFGLGAVGGEESDNDSAVSSSRSSISHGYTPPHSPMPGFHRSEGIGVHNMMLNNNGGGLMLKRTLSSETTASTSSNGSTLTSGSQASCSSNSSIDSRRVLKPQSVEAINRKNVLSSAKFSSGLDLKTPTTPVPNNPIDNQILNQNDNVAKIRANSISPAPITVIEHEIVDPEDQLNGENNNSFNEKELISLEGDGADLEPLADINDHNPLVLSKEFFAEDHRKNECMSSILSSPSINSSSIIQDEPDSVSTKDSVDSLDSNKSINSSSEWDEKDVPQIIPKPLENGGSRYCDYRSRPMKLSPTQKSVSVNSIKKVFEKVDSLSTPSGRLKSNGLTVNTNIQHPRVSSIDSTTSDDSYIPMPNTPYGSISNLQKEQQFGSITSLASSTSLISQQELAQLIEEANQNLEDGGNSHEVIVVILHRDTPGGSIGITLAGGADYEAKEITVHKVLVGSPAERDGRIQKGDRILSINGKSMKGLTHYESLAILKAPRPEVVLVISRHKADTPEEVVSPRSSLTNSRLSRYIEPTKYAPTFEKGADIKWGPVVTVELVKDGAGLGFSLEGGKDSPFGDQPLTVKKIFTGGCAEKCGLLYAGDELLSVNNIGLSELSRIEAWALMKRLPDGTVNLNIRHPIS